MRSEFDGYVDAGTFGDLVAEGMRVVSTPGGPVLLIVQGDAVHALDNRCPHMGFPLHRGSLANGILTCHWHHARFDVRSGCTFDLWADDVPVRDVRREDDRLWVAAYPKRFGAEHWRRRLEEGLEHNIRLVIAKAILGARAAGSTNEELIAQAAAFGTRNRDGWGSGLTILTAMANLLPLLDDDDRFLALLHGIGEVAEDCESRPPRRDRLPLAGGLDRETLAGWLRQWVRVRHRDGAERTLLAAVSGANDASTVATLLLAAATDRAFADGGHLLDFVNKAFELLRHVGAEKAASVLPTIVGDLVGARGREEADSWRHPVDLLSLLEAAFSELPEALAEGRAARGRWRDGVRLASAVLADDPERIADTLTAAVRAGAAPQDLSRAVALAAASRLARFGTANELSDWESAHHAFTYCNAAHQMLGQARLAAVPDDRVVADGLRAVFHGAMAVYLIRYLNVPPAAAPIDAELEALPSDSDDIAQALHAAFDRQHALDEVACLVARHLRLGHPARRLIANLGHALLREDASFHAFQNLEAAAAQCAEWSSVSEQETILLGAARYLAAHTPTQRARHQTARIAMRLHRGDSLHEAV